jgi:SAM-dependent methyltransferase
MRTARAVAADYDERVRLYRTEIASVARPVTLARLLSGVRDVAELPSGTGHFLADYAAAGAAVTLLDANPRMLAAAVEHAAAVGLPAARVHARRCFAQEVDDLSGVGLVVVPNAALNQLAAQTPLVELLSAWRGALRPGAFVLAQALCAHSGGQLDVAGCYDARQPDGVWFADRRLVLEATQIVRRRRQHRIADRVHVDFAYHDPSGRSLNAANVDLRLMTPCQLVDALRAVGFSLVRFRAGRHGLSEFVARVERP